MGKMKPLVNILVCTCTIPESSSTSCAILLFMCYIGAVRCYFPHLLLSLASEILKYSMKQQLKTSITKARNCSTIEPHEEINSLVHEYFEKNIEFRYGQKCVKRSTFSICRASHNIERKNWHKPTIMRPKLLILNLYQAKDGIRKYTLLLIV